MKQVRPVESRGKLCGVCSEDKWIRLRDNRWGCTICRTDAVLRYRRRRGVALTLLSGARARARKSGVPCTIRYEDIQIPFTCPVLGTPIRAEGGTREDKWDSPSLDQIRPGQGYVVGNIRVISYRANTLKNSATCAELEAVLQYMRSQPA